MTLKILRTMVLLSIIILAVACGTMATPVFEATDEEAVVDAQGVQEDHDEEVAVEPTETPIPPTATPTDEPTATVEPPTATPTDEPAAAPADPITRLVASRDPVNGEILFNNMFPQTGFACETCHFTNQDGTKIGPSFINISEVAGTRIEGVSAERYLYDSILNPNDYITEGFTAGVMPQIWGDVLSDTEIYDIIAYLMTLDGS